MLPGLLFRAGPRRSSKSPGMGPRSFPYTRGKEIDCHQSWTWWGQLVLSLSMGWVVRGVDREWVSWCSVEPSPWYFAAIIPFAPHLVQVFAPSDDDWKSSFTVSRPHQRRTYPWTAHLFAGTQGWVLLMRITQPLPAQSMTQHKRRLQFPGASSSSSVIAVLPSLADRSPLSLQAGRSF